MEEEIINKVAQSGIITIDLEDYYPKTPIVSFDIKPLLFMEMLLKEKDFRQQLKEMDWAPYADKIVAIHCSSDAIIPRWAYMLLAIYLEPIAGAVYVGAPDEIAARLLLEEIQKIEVADFEGKRMVIKGCGDLSIGAEAYLLITQKLLPVAQSIMYGEPCSTVPVYKKKK